jgi:DNA-directed RNA polymerase specialized sigma24 family protein
MSADREQWKSVLNAAGDGDALALLQLTRHIGKLLESYGAYTIRKEWAEDVRQIASAVLEGWGETGSQAADTHIESVAKNRFWGQVLDLMTQNNMKAGQLFFPTVRRLLGKWDGARRAEAQWDDIAQETAHQLWESWMKGGVNRPWSLLCTIAKRRYLDKIRAERHTEEIEDQDTEELGDGPGELFTEQALAVLEEEERQVVIQMDIEGRTRVEIADSLGVTEGQVLSTRRAGLRRIWRWLGRDLPPTSRAVWEEMFKGARRIPPEEVAEKLGMATAEVIEILEEARVLTGLA